MTDSTFDSNHQLIMKRRQFLTAAAGIVAAGATASVLTSCAPAAKKDESERKPVGTGQPEYDKIARSVCAPNCVGSCGINAYVKDDTIVKIEPAEFPDNRYRRMCLRGVSNAMQRVYSPDRIKYPMKRVGERGSGEFERISWEAAIDLIHEKMQKNIDTYGPTANAFLGMTGNYGVFPQIIDGLLASTYDATQFTNFGIMGDNGCNMGFLPPLGVQQDSSSWEDLIGSKAIIMFGCNYAETNMQEMHFIFDAQESGSKLVVVDPRFSRTAAKADWWIPLRPGTDAALVMGMMSYIVAQEKHDKAYLRTYTNGAFLVDVATKKLVRDGKDYLVWDEKAGKAVPIAALSDDLKPAYPSVKVTGDVPESAKVPQTAALQGSYSVVVGGATIEAKPAFQLIVDSLAEYTPELASAICEVPADDIVKLAELYVNETPASLRVSQGTNRYWNGHLPTRALIQLAGITGNIGKPHANINWAGGSLMRILFSLAPTAVTPRPGHKASPLPGSQWYDIVAHQKPYPVKMLWTHNYGWGTQGPDRNRMIKEVFPQLDFIVVSEQVMTPGACYADLVLPVTSYYEEPFELLTSWSNMYVQVREQAITQQWEAKTDYQVAQMLAEKFGILEETEWKLDIEEYARKHIIGESVAPEFSSIDFDELMKKRLCLLIFLRTTWLLRVCAFRRPAVRLNCTPKI